MVRFHRGQSLAALYPGFVDLLHNPALGAATSAALYWYLRSNRAGEGAGVDSGLILSLAALERLSVACLGSAGLKVPTKAGDKIREACRHLGIPTAVPSSTKRLLGGRRAGDWTDGPHAIVRVRNELVHPDKRLKVKVGPMILDAWRLAQWYIELMILRLSFYSGEYSNRLKARWVGENEPVPWARRISSS